MAPATGMSLLVRDERPTDRVAVRTVVAAAFGRDDEAVLVERLRDRATGCVSLVAELRGEVVGHLMLASAMLEGHSDTRLMSLAPLAVRPDVQRTGVGSALVRAALARCTSSGVGAVAVLGHPGYYPRFGFAPASTHGLRCVYDAPDEAFMVVETLPDHLRNRSGTVHYHAAFAGLGERPPGPPTSRT